jgi:hypothetical protein
MVENSIFWHVFKTNFLKLIYQAHPGQLQECQGTRRYLKKLNFITIYGNYILYGSKRQGLFTIVENGLETFRHRFQVPSPQFRFKLMSPTRELL